MEVVVHRSAGDLGQRGLDLFGEIHARGLRLGEKLFRAKIKVGIEGVELGLRGFIELVAHIFADMIGQGGDIPYRPGRQSHSDNVHEGDGRQAGPERDLSDLGSHFGGEIRPHSADRGGGCCRGQGFESSRYGHSSNLHRDGQRDFLLESAELFKVGTREFGAFIVDDLPCFGSEAIVDRGKLLVETRQRLQSPHGGIFHGLTELAGTKRDPLGRTVATERLVLSKVADEPPDLVYLDQIMDRRVDAFGSFCAVLIFDGRLPEHKRVPDLLFGVGRFGIQVSQRGADFLDTLSPVEVGAV